MTTKERKVYATIIILAIIAVALSAYLAVTVEGGTASLDACAGCLKMAAGMSN